MDEDGNSIPNCMMFDGTAGKPNIDLNMSETNLHEHDDLLVGIKSSWSSHKECSSVPSKQYPLFVILEAFGSFFFAPSFGDFDYYSITYDEGDKDIVVIPSTPWPDIPGNVTGLHFYAAATNQSMNWLFGNLEYIEFGWSE